MTDLEKQHFLEGFARDLADLDRGYSVDGPHNLAVLLPDKTYRTKAIGTDVDFLMASIRLGKNGDLLFCFEPEDAQEYERVEVRLKKLDQVFPLMLTSIVEVAKARYGTEAVNQTTPGDQSSLTSDEMMEILFVLEEAEARLRAEREQEELLNLPNQGIF